MIGILMLNTQFPRVAGDIGNPGTFDHQAVYHRVDQAMVKTIVSNQPLSETLLEEFVKGTHALKQMGASVVGTSCGFLASCQARIQRRTDIPVITSSLVLIPTLQTLFGDDVIIGVLTFDNQKLGSIHLALTEEKEISASIRIAGLPQDGELYQCIKNDHLTLDTNLAWGDVRATTQSMVAAHPQIDVLLIECTNISPYKARLRAEFGLPVFDLVDALKWIDQSSSS